MSGKNDYIDAVIELNAFITSQNEELQELESAIDVQLTITKKIDRDLEDSLFAAKARRIRELIKRLENDLTPFSARDMQ